jgi:hypothetical protein
MRSLSPHTKNSAPDSSQSHTSRAASRILVPGKRHVQPKEAVALVRHELVFVEEVGGAPLLAKEQPVASGCAGRPSFLDEGAERREPCSWPDHDHRRVGTGRHGEVFLLVLQVQLGRAAHGPSVGEPGRADTEPFAATYGVAHGHDQQVYLVRVGALARGHRIQAREILP